MVNRPVRDLCMLRCWVYLLICVTGFHASTTQQFADSFVEALTLSSEDALAMRLRARKSSSRFSEEVFGSAWLKQLERLIELGNHR